MEGPSTDLPATTEPVAHIAQAANPTPTHVPPVLNHPPYAEMITAAIVALKERDGSSRQAIAKYIEKEYPNLPPSHSALLTHHLKRLKNSGQLAMVKHSYMLPRSVPFPLSPLPPPGNDSFAPAGDANPTSSFDGPKRRPGRPPKFKPEAQPNGIVGPQNVMASVGLVDGPPQPPPGMIGGPTAAEQMLGPFGGPANMVPSYGGVFGGPGNMFGGPVNTVPMYGMAGGQPAAVPMYGVVDGQQQAGVPRAEFGFVDGPRAKRGRGRPPKDKTVVIGAEPVSVFSAGQVDGTSGAVGKKRPGRPPKVHAGLVGTTVARISRRGRPPKPKSISALLGNGVVKRGRGRPPSGLPRPIGRPKKGVAYAVRPGGRPRGRPPKNVIVNGVGGIAAVVPIEGGSGVLPVKRPGRPPKMGGVKKPRKLSGKPLGRPKKNASAIQAAEQQQLAAYQELKAKVEHFQSRIKQAVSVVKPYLNNETAVIAVGALQELEELASMDVSTPLNVNVQAQVPLEPHLQN